MKFKLMIQSLSPLALLTIIRNFSFVTTTSANQKLSFNEFIAENAILLVVMLFCLIWIIMALIFFISFGAFKWSDKQSGFEVCSVIENEDASLNFFLTLIIPLLLDDVNTIQGALTFLIIVFLLQVPVQSTCDNCLHHRLSRAVCRYQIYRIQ